MFPSVNNIAHTRSLFIMRTCLLEFHAFSLHVDKISYKDGQSDPQSLLLQTKISVVFVFTSMMNVSQSTTIVL
jgi:hypothetical protein